MSTSFKAGFALVGGLLVAFGIWLAADPWMRTQVFTGVHHGAPFWGPVIAIVILVIVAVVASFSDMRAVSAIVGTFAFLALVASIFYWAQYGYQTKQVYLQSVTTVADEVPTFDERAAYSVANSQAKPLLGNVRGTVQDMRFVPDGDSSTFNALVVRQGTFTGYQAVEVGTFDLTGTGDAETCEFSADASRRLGGHFSHSLDRAIAAAAPGTEFDATDAYGYCDGDTPYVVVPLTRPVGWAHVTQLPAGVALYNGDTGTTEVKATVKDGEMPGPVFPQSLAGELRASTEASGSYWDYVKSRTGYDSTDGDASDPNVAGGNTTEFNLGYTKSDAAAYVTPLTPKGDGLSIVALAEVSSSSVTAGQMNDLTVHTLAKTRVPGSTIAKNIRGDYGDLPEWAAGMNIFEVTPLDNDRFVASLGQDQSIAYRVYINPDGTSCLAYADGTKIRCGKVTGTNGNGIGNALQPDGATGSVALPTSPAEIAGMSDQALSTLLNQLSSEVVNRMAVTDTKG